MSKKHKHINLSKLERQCDYRRSRSSIPWNVYHKKIEYIQNIIEKTKKKIKDKRILEEIRKQQIVSLVTALEVYLRDMFIFIIDEKNIKTDKILDSKKENLSLLDVIRYHNLLKEKEWKPAELLANKYNFQNLQSIESAYRELLNINVLTELKGYKVKDKAGKTYKLDKDYNDKIKKILELRHSITHDINFRKKISYDRLVEIFNYLHFFVDTFDIYLEEKYKLYE
jgi:hypothetical protein